MITRHDHYLCEYDKAEFSHAGDLGDIIWGTSAIRLWLERSRKEKAKLYLFDAPGRTTHTMDKARAELIAPLLNAQPWLQVMWSPVPVLSDLNGFRDHCRNAATIAGSHLCAIGMDGGGAHTDAVSRRWLDVPPPATALPPEWQVVFVRTHRYKSHDFPWRQIVDWFGPQAVFLGLECEYKDFVRDHPRAATVPHVVTNDFLAAAQIIDHAKLFVGNQTSLFGVAEALKKPRVLESFAPCRNCEYGSRNCLPLHPGMRVTAERILELLDAPHTV